MASNRLPCKSDASWMVEPRSFDQISQAPNGLMRWHQAVHQQAKISFMMDIDDVNLETK